MSHFNSSNESGPSRERYDMALMCAIVFFKGLHQVASFKVTEHVDLFVHFVVLGSKPVALKLKLKGVQHNLPCRNIMGL